MREIVYEILDKPLFDKIEKWFNRPDMPIRIKKNDWDNSLKPILMKEFPYVDTFNDDVDYIWIIAAK